MIWRAALLAILFAWPLHAAPVAVRSGEHADFSRLVFEFPGPASWSLEPVDGGYRLRTDTPDPSFQTDRVFDLIPRDRVRSVTPLPGGDGVLIKTADGIVAEGFELRAGLVVVDFRADPLTPPPTQPDATPRPTPAPRPQEAKAQPAAVNAGPPPPVALDSTHLDLYWRGALTGAPLPPKPAPAEKQAQAEPPPVTAPPPEFDIVSKRASELEAELQRQIARAASQGLVSVDMPKLDPPPAAKDHSPASETAPSPAAPTHSVEDHIAFRSETAIDRDMNAADAGTGRTASGLKCAPDEDFDLAAWQGEDGVSEQIGAARRSLMGEFDVPNQDAVMQLARVYLAYGFGAEARGVLRDLGKPGPQQDALLYLADLFDGNADATQSPFSRMTDCSGPVVLWALMGADPLPRKDDVDMAALQRAYLGLSPELRQTIGPDLVSKLLAIGASDVAHTLRPALARVSEKDTSSLEMVDAQIGLHAGEPKATAELQDVVAKDGSHAVQALLLLVDERLSQDQAIDAGTTENAKALAFEMKGAPVSYPLLRAAALGHGSVGQFEQAFGLLDEWPQDAAPELRTGTINSLFTQISKLPIDSRFITAYFQHRDMLDGKTLDPATRQGLARRLVDFGFAKPAQELILQGDPLNDTDHLLLGAAALKANDPSAALAHLEALPGAEATALRAQALAEIGDHAQAHEAFVAAGEPKRAMQEAWRDANWNAVLQSAEGAQKQFAETFAKPPIAADDGTKGPLGRAEALIAASREERDAFRKLLETLKLPQDPAAAPPTN